MLKIMLKTKINIKTREYLPIQLINVDECPPGLAWISF